MRNKKPQQNTQIPVTQAMLQKIGKNLDFSDIDLRKLDLTRKYDDLSDPDGLTWRDHLLLYAIAALMGFFILWASLTTVEEVARGDGKVVPSSQVQIIQNLEGGIIDEFLVHEGDTVDTNQVLLKMRNVQAKSDFSANTQKYLGLMATIQRLQAEADGKDTIEFSEEVMKGAPESVTAEQEAFEANKRQRSGQLGILEQQRAQKQQEIAELNRKIQDLSGVLKLAQDERNMVAPMVSSGAAAKMELLQLDRQMANQRAEINALRLSLPRTQSALREAEERIAELTSGVKADAQKELASKTIELNTIKETLTAFQDRSERTEIKSPVHGKVQALKVNTVGGVVRPGEPIMEIVPLEDLLVVEGRIKPSDIAFIAVGQPAVVRISAFDFSVYGALEGKVTEISPDSITNEKGESFYRIRIQTDQTSLKKGSKEYPIIPGMQATVDIITGKKSVMKYLLKPFIKASQEALRER